MEPLGLTPPTTPVSFPWGSSKRTTLSGTRRKLYLNPNPPKFTGTKPKTLPDTAKLIGCDRCKSREQRGLHKGEPMRHVSKDSWLCEYHFHNPLSVKNIKDLDIVG